MLLAVVQQQQLNVPETSWAGHTTMAGMGIALIVVSVLCIKGRELKDKSRQQMGPWGPAFGALMERIVGRPSARMMDNALSTTGSEGFDWKSLMTFVIGLFGMTAVVSSAPGPLLTFIGWFQALIMSLSSGPGIQELGAGGICLILGFLAWRQRNDDKKDLTYGAVCGFMFPMGGGSFSELTLQVGHWIPMILHLG